MQPGDKGIVLTCETSGKIVAVEKNNTALHTKELTGLFLTELVPEHERGSIMSLLAETHQSDASFGKTAHLGRGKERLKFFLSSVRLGETILVVGSQSKADFEGFLTEMMSINNDQTNELRRRIKMQSTPRSTTPAPNQFLDLQEFTRLNNDLVNMQRELARKNNQLTHLNEEKNRILGMAVHDLRNPLSVILNSAEIVLEEALDISEDAKSFLLRIHDLAGLMLEIVDDLLDFSVIESGRLTLKTEEVKLSEFISRVSILQSAIALRKNITIISKVDPDTLVCRIDRRRMDQVLTNLLVNAIKFSYPGTTVTISAAREGDEIIITVADQGQGIPEDELQSLFKPFARMSVRPTGDEKSTGLGLLIVKKIVESHNGTIKCESRVGVGTSFTIKLPV